jgi:hypothetical protein
VDFTREPVVETIITPRDGCKLALRNSKGIGQEEFFLDSVELVSFGQALFFRSLERPKNFLVPVSDYEILEVREAKVTIKHATPGSGGIKIGAKEGKEKKVKQEVKPSKPQQKESEPKLEKKRDRRKSRRKRSKEESEVETDTQETAVIQENQEPIKQESKEVAPKSIVKEPLKEALQISSLLPPPRTLISETIAKYKDVSLIKEKAEKELQQVLVEVEKVSSEKVPVTEVITQASEPLLLEKKNDLNTEPTVNENKEVETSEKVKDAPVKKSTKRRASTRTKKVKETES